MRFRPLSRSILAVALAAILSALVTIPSRTLSARSGYRIICHPSNPISSADRQFLEDTFLKKVREWPGGASSHPIDLQPSSVVRREFSNEILRRPVEAIRSYWQQRIFAGRDLPPPEVGDDDEVVRMVLKDPGADGYVSSAANLKGAKVLTVD
jgi:ABC-type phosphate transport system substrate-binding protein